MVKKSRKIWCCWMFIAFYVKYIIDNVFNSENLDLNYPSDKLRTSGQI